MTIRLLIIDTRVNDYQVFITSRQEGVFYVELDYYNDTYSSLTQRIITELSGHILDSVALVSHAVRGNEFRLLQNEYGSILLDVQGLDTSLNTWDGFRSFWEGIGATTIDLLGCALYMDENWRYVLDNLEKQMGVNFRASIDDTGALAVGANWVLESDNVNAKDVYFTDDIEGWIGILASEDVMSAIIDGSGRLYTAGWYNGRSGDSNRFGLLSGLSGEVITQVSMLNYSRVALCVTESGKLYAWGISSGTGSSVSY
jgi:hypothetical protein